MIEWNFYSPDGSLNSKNTYKYDGKSNLIESNYFEDGTFKSTSTHKYEYDKNNNWVKHIEFESDSYEGQYILEREIEYY